ncbi:GapS4a family protein [Methylobacter tundripaludum]|uniref:GAPS4 PD-(D/E)XK nuclease domain-containing protein n=1 Tax=Methylobacter tundripaludum (strain ATCC BAA-1195 / DSM 17260 / SV96) TaxID=697282 RepID=G3IYD4_METTV|nr:hypothetical protein [Methylobacter tundripaludum]EGW21156.1 hypothetical protein Mettu_4316 [Methylobacter tundripaludum SV96]
MGGKSNESGKIGEQLASSLLEMIGWKPSIHNLTIKCNTPTHLTESGNQRTTHEEDQFFIYHNPFHDDHTEIVHISVKNNIDQYPQNAALKTSFKAHLKELHEIIECAKHDPKLIEITNSFGAKRHKHHSGLLVWLQNDKDNIEQNIKSDLSNSQLEQSNDVPVYLIDNARASFLLKVVDDLKRRSNKDNVDDLTTRSVKGNVEFFYPQIGTSMGVNESRTGKMIPLELIAADIIFGFIRNTEGSVQELVIYANQTFSVDSYKRLIAYALQFVSGSVSVIKIGMPDYNPTHHGNDAKQARLVFNRREESITPFSFERSILNFLDEETK